MGCAPSSPNNNLLLGNGKSCTCQCHENGKAKGVMSTPATSHAHTNEAMAENFKEDPRIPLTGRQIFLIKRSWRGISRNMCETGINMFLSLFEKNSSLIKFFGGLQSYKTLTELRYSKVLESHVKGVMMTVDEAITNLDDADYTVNMLLTVGRSHTRFKNFDPEAFMLLKEPFLLAVSDTLGDRYSAHMEDIYQKAIEFILTTLVAGFGPTDQISTALQNPEDTTGGTKEQALNGNGHALKAGVSSEE